MVYGREHRLHRHQAGRGGGDALASPERADGVDGLADALDAALGRVGDAHLGQAQRQPRAHAQHDPVRSHLVERADSHGHQHGVPRKRVERAQAHADIRHLRGHRRRIAHGVALEIGVVEPDGVQAGLARGARPGHRVLDAAARRQADADRLNELTHSRYPFPSTSASQIASNPMTHTHPKGRLAFGRAVRAIFIVIQFFA